MAKRVTYKLDRFDGGWTNDLRDKQANKTVAAGHFDTRTRPRTLTPYRDMESADADAANNFITQFLGYNNKVYGFGTSSGGSVPRIWERSDFTGNTWTAHAAAGTGTRYPYVFIEQGTNAFMWETATPDLYTSDLDGSSAPGATFAPGTFTGASFFGQPCVHSKDKKVYLPYDNKIARVDTGVLSESNVLAVPSSLQIPCVSEYGNFLAVGVRPTSNRFAEHSAVYLWDRDSSLSTLSEIIDCGAEHLQIVDVADGELITISANINRTSANLNSKVVFRRFNGRTFEVFHEIECSAILASQVIQRQKYNGRLYFNLIAEVNGTTHAGIWSVGRSGPGAPLTVALEHIPDPNGTVEVIYGFKLIDDYLFVSTNRSATEYVWKTNDSESYTTTSFYETPIIDGDDPSYVKNLIGATIMTAPMPTAGQVVLKYKVDGDTSWTTLLTNTTDGSLSAAAVRNAAGNLVTGFKEIRFRIESTGGAEITGLSCTLDLVKRDAPYE